MNIIYVYGTLKTGFCRNHFLENQLFLGVCKTEPIYKLYKVYDFPGLIEVAENGVSVIGELWQVDDDCLKRLDRMEGHPTLFKRDVVKLEREQFAQAYFWQGEIEKDMQDVGDSWQFGKE